MKKSKYLCASSLSRGNSSVFADLLVRFEAARGPEAHAGGGDLRLLDAQAAVALQVLPADGATTGAVAAAVARLGCGGAALALSL